MKLKDLLNIIPNNVSGDGKNFVIQLKKFLAGIEGMTEEKLSSIGEGSVNQVSNVRCTVTHTTNEFGPQNNIVVEYDTTNVADFSFAQIWLREGTDGIWQQKGNSAGVKYIIEGVDAKTYYVRVVACNKNAGYAEFSQAPTVLVEVKSAVYLCGTPTQFYWDGEKWVWSGYTDNGYTDYFEVRLDQKPGVWNENLLDVTTSYFSTVPPTSRSGTAYLYVRNVYGQYNVPAVHVFNIAAPVKPNVPTYESTLNGVVFTFQTLPSGCTGYIVEIDDDTSTETYDITNSQWTYFQFSGTFNIRYAFVDRLGQGLWSDQIEVQATYGIKAEWLNERSFVADELNAATKKALMNALGAAPTSSLNNYYTKSQTDDAIAEMAASFDTSGQLTNYYTKTQTDTQISTQLGSYSTTDAMTSAINQSAEAITSIVAKESKGNGYLVPVATYNGLSNTTANSTWSYTTNTARWTAKYEVVVGETYYVSTQVANRTSGTRPLIRFTNASNVVLSTNFGDNSLLADKTTSVNYDVVIDTVTIPANAKYMYVESSANTNNTVQSASACIKVRKASLDGTYSAITQLSNGIQLTVSGTTGTSSINLTENTLSLNTNLLTVGSDNSLVTITDGAVTAAKLAANSVTAAKIAANAVTTDKINAGAITAGKIAANAITIGGNGNNVTIQDGAINGSKIMAATIIGSKLAANTITAANMDTSLLTVGGTDSPVTIANGAITADKISANAVTAAKLAAGAVTADKIDITNGSTKARISISNNLIQVYDSNNVLRVRMGVW